MKRIPLTQGMEALVSDCDYAFLMQWDWCYSKRKIGGYAKRGTRLGGKHRTVYMHDVVARRMKLKGEIDHQHRDKCDNRRNSLRSATHTQNQGNHGLHDGSVSGYKGVRPNTRDRVWQVGIGYNRWQYNLGSFPKSKLGKIRAAYAYNVAALLLFNRFAVTNKVNHLLDTNTKRRIKRDVLARLKAKELI